MVPVEPVSVSVWIWVSFTVFILLLLLVDLGLFQRNAHAVSVKESLAWTFVWVVLACGFGGIMYWWHGYHAALEFFTGYIIEYSLSVDNLFIFILIFTYFKVPDKYRHRILFWGILGALIMRGVMIGVGAALISAFHWIIYIFGAFLIITGIRMFFHKDEDIDPSKNILVRWAKKVFPVTHEYHGQHFFIREAGRLTATPLLLVLLVIESTDLIFAVDSIPAIFAVTRDPFIVFTSNVFAILGLRSLYFALAGVMDMFHFLKYGLAFVLAFVGVKMCVSGYYPIPITLSLGIVVGVLGLSVLFSLIFPKKSKELAEVPHHHKKH